MTTRKTKKKPVVRNKFEQSVVDCLTKNKALFQYEEVKLPYVLEKMYLTDFSVYDKKTGNLKLFIEAKGYMDVASQVKMRAVKKAHPDADIRFLFQNATKKVRKGSKLTYADWATKYGFPFAVGEVPKAWLK